MAKILIITHNDKLSNEMSSMLKYDGHEVFVAQGEQSGRSLASRENPDLAIVDVSKGNLIISILKKEFPQMQLVCWMHERNSQNAVNLMKSGAADCLCLPMRAAEVTGVVAHVLGLSSSKDKGTMFFMPKYGIWRYRKTINAVLAAAAVCFLVYFFWPKDHTKVYDLSFKNPTGISGDGTNLWVSDWYTQSIFQYTYKDEVKLKKNYYFASYGPVAVTTDGKFIWTCGNDLMLRKHVISEHMEVVNSFLIKDLSPSGIVVLSDTIFISDAAKKKISHFSTEGYLSLITDYSCPVSNPVGLSFDGRYFWLADPDEDRVYILQKVAGKLEVKTVYQLAPVALCRIAGLYPEKKYLYVVYSGDPAKLVRYRKEDLKQIKLKISKD